MTKKEQTRERWGRLIILLGVAFALNAIWEEAHHVLYVAYQGGDITHVILIRAALADALITGVLFGPLFFFVRGKRMLWISASLALIVAVGMERFALSTDRWAYASTMPIVPL